MWKTLAILVLLSLSVAAQAKDNAPTAENWEDHAYTSCNPDPNDPIALTPIIFTPQFATVKETKKYWHPPTEFVIVPESIDKDGNIIPAKLYKRVIPDMSTPRYYRTLDKQFVGFLDRDGVFVDELGQPISATNPLEPLDIKERREFQHKYQRVLWERPNCVESAKLDSAVQSYKGQCEYHIEQNQYEDGVRRIRKAISNPQFACKAGGGYEMQMPEFSETIEPTRIKTKDRRLILWDNQGIKHTGSFVELSELFNSLGSKQCQWKKAKITP